MTQRKLYSDYSNVFCEQRVKLCYGRSLHSTKWFIIIPIHGPLLWTRSTSYIGQKQILLEDIINESHETAIECCFTLEIFCLRSSTWPFVSFSAEPGNVSVRLLSVHPTTHDLPRLCNKAKGRHVNVPWCDSADHSCRICISSWSVWFDFLFGPVITDWQCGSAASLNTSVKSLCVVATDNG